MLTVLTGRSRRLWPRVVQEIGEALSQGGGRLLLLVPGQFTLQAELELVDRLNLPGFFDIDVLSPSRLMTRVFQLAGSPNRIRIDDTGKSMVLADVLEGARRDMRYYGGAVQRRGFTKKLASAIGDFKRAGMLPEDIAALADAMPEGDALRGKLEDIRLLYERYEEKLLGQFLDAEDAQEALSERLPESGLLDGAQVWVYGFDLITYKFLRQIAVMSRHAKAVRLALTYEEETATDGAVFSPPRDTLKRLARYFDAEGLLWEKKPVREELPAPPAIRHVERQLFAVPQRPFDGDHAPITLWAAKNPYDEALHVAASIRELARDGVPLESVAVVLGDADAYAGALEGAFAAAGVPYHLARKRPLVAHPLPRAVVSALRVATRGWRAKDALDFLASGFSGLDEDERERLALYAVEHGLTGGKWRKVILSSPEIESLRVRFVQPLEALQQALRDAETATESLAAVYQMLETVEAYQRLTAWQEELTRMGRIGEAADLAQAWRLLLESLDQMHALSGGARRPMGTFARVLEAGLDTAELGALPQAPGAVQAGQLGHVKLGGDVQVLFLMGMEDGVPQMAAESLLTEAESERAESFAARDAAFGLRGDALARLTRINLLDTLAAPSRQLFISRAQVGAGGEAKRPAAVLKLLRRVLPELKERGGIAGEDAVWRAPGTALAALGPALRQGTPQGEALEASAWLLNAPQSRAQAERTLRALEAPPAKERLPLQVADLLYARRKTAVTRLEAYAYCPKRHFLAFGLNPVPVKEFEVYRKDTGTFYHRAMEQYVEMAAGDPAWPAIDRQASDRLMNEALAPLRAEWENTPLDENAMLRATGESFCRVARRAAWNYTAQMRASRFRTGMVEARFGPGQPLPAIELELPGGRRCYLEGRIDRIDLCREEGRTWLRVVDYKSSRTMLKMEKLERGVQLQLMLYLSAALNAYPDAKAAGAVYARMDDPFEKIDSNEASAVERALMKALRPRGVLLSELQQRGMVDDVEFVRTDLVDEETLALRMRRAREVAGEIAEGIAQGEIGAKPAEIDGRKACQTCDFRDGCGYEG